MLSLTNNELSDEGGISIGMNEHRVEKIRRVTAAAKSNEGKKRFGNSK